jgi:hypothetical protein
MFVHINDYQIINADLIVRAAFQPKEGEQPNKLTLYLRASEDTETVEVEDGWADRTWGELNQRG